MTVKQLLSLIDADELAEWEAFDSLEPFGDMRADVRAGVVASTLANIHRKRGAKAFKMTDFMPMLKLIQPQQTEEEMKSVLMAAFAEFRKAQPGKGK